MRTNVPNIVASKAAIAGLPTDSGARRRMHLTFPQAAT
jgi:hypothetical protein